MGLRGWCIALGRTVPACAAAAWHGRTPCVEHIAACCSGDGGGITPMWVGATRRCGSGVGVHSDAHITNMRCAPGADKHDTTYRRMVVNKAGLVPGLSRMMPVKNGLTTTTTTTAADTQHSSDWCVVLGLPLCLFLLPASQPTRPLCPVACLAPCMRVCHRLYAQDLVCTVCRHASASGVHMHTC